ncbi:MAG: YceI family protein, partial [Sphingobacteriales bacterium]
MNKLIYKLVLNFIVLLALQFCSIQTYSQTIFSTKEAKISLYSSAPLEDIKAQSNQGYSVIVPKSQQIAFKLAISSLVFPRPLMQEHFNENYMESEKYPYGLFKGTIVDVVD